MRIQIGYSRASDESVSSGSWDVESSLTRQQVRDLLADPDVTEAWWRDATLIYQGHIIAPGGIETEGWGGLAALLV